jgi:dTDP-4-amino-4,6-dideoxygalactose transaminase
MERISANRRNVCRHYNSRLSAIREIKVPKTDFADVTSFLFYIRVPEVARDALRAHLEQKGIDTGIHWQPGHRFTLLSGCRRGDLSVTERVGREILSLPLHSSMNRDTADVVADAIVSFFARN